MRRLVAAAFFYDSLSRLLWANNPEVGLICYGVGDGTTAGCQTNGYDPNGNLVYKTDARGITTGYIYDGLNRVTSQSFTGQNANASAIAGSTPTSTYTYDSMPGISVSNGIGHLVSEGTQLGTTVLTQTLIPSYDEMGRVKQELQVPLSTVSSAPYTFSYTYDLMGKPTSWTNGLSSEPITLTAVYDSNARLTTLSSSWDDPTHPSTLFAPPNGTSQYGPLGLVAASLGMPSSASQTTFSEQLTYDNRMRITSDLYSGQTVTASATQSTGSISITGFENSMTRPASPATGSITFDGEDDYNSNCEYIGSRLVCKTLYDSGTVTVTVNGYSASASYAGGTSGPTTNSVATSVAAALNNTNSPVTASVSGSTVNLVSKATGVTSNYAFTVTISRSDDFDDITSGTSLTGGADSSTTGDTGNLTLNLNGTPVAVSWQLGSTVQSISSQLATAIQATGIATMSGTSSPFTIISTATGSAANWFLGCSSSDTGSQTASFSVSCNGMSGGAAGSTGQRNIYGYVIPTGGYAANGNLLSITDSVMGSWSYSYDNLNRLMQATVNSGTYLAGGTNTNIMGAVMGWGYDSFGNREVQTSTNGILHSNSMQYSGYSNRPSGTGVASSPSTSLTTLQYDLAGNNTGQDGAVTNAFDAEGRLCATLNTSGGYVQYLYNAEGLRVAKQSVGSLTCNPLTPGLSPTNLYLLDAARDQVSELDGTGAWLNSKVYLGSRLLSTYDQIGLHFHFTDGLGTHRVQATIKSPGVGAVDDVCQSLPYGDGLSCTGSEENHFTGKERDTESGLDYFGARYYGSSVGRFMSPDWSASADPVPYARMDNPQSLNLYAYVGNNPLSKRDGDGHMPCGGSADIMINVNANGTSSMSQTPECPDNSSNWLMFAGLVGGGFGHHYIPQSISSGFNNLTQRLANNITSGPLVDKTKNYYDALHRAYNDRVRTIIQEYLRDTGKSMKELSASDLKAIIQKMKAAGGEIEEFNNRLSTDVSPTLRNIDQAFEHGMQESGLNDTLGAVQGAVGDPVGAVEVVIETCETNGCPIP